MKRKPYPLIVKSIFALIILLLPLNLLSLLTTAEVMKNAQSTLSDSVYLPLNTQMELIDAQISNTNFFLYNILQNNADCIAMLNQNDDWKYEYHKTQLYYSVNENLALSNAADLLFFYMDKKDDLLPIYKGSDKPVTRTDIMDVLLSSDLSDGKWHLLSIEGRMILSRTVEQKTYRYGAVIDLSSYITEISRIMSYSYNTLAFSDAPMQESNQNMAFSVKSSHTSLYLNLSIPKSEITQNIDLRIRIISNAMLAYLLIIPVLYILFRKYVTRPLSVLNQGHQQLVMGNENYQIEVPAKSREFQQAYASFNHMASTLKQLRIEKLNKELSEKQLQLDNLKLQIRPHFLLNTLNFLYTLVQTGQMDSAQDLILYLSKYFRYMFRTGKDLEMFDKELALIQEYMKISALHYPDSFQVSYQIDPSISQMRIPPLLLHNFFENIIQHSLISGKIIHIIFYAEYEDHVVTIQISDDGRGMAPEMVAHINAMDFSTEKSNTHLGLRNSVNRIKYYYGQTASLTVESAINRGTLFTLRIPYNLDSLEGEDE